MVFQTIQTGFAPTECQELTASQNPNYRYDHDEPTAGILFQDKIDCDSTKRLTKSISDSNLEQQSDHKALCFSTVESNVNTPMDVADQGNSSEKSLKSEQSNFPPTAKWYTTDTGSAHQPKNDSGDDQPTKPTSLIANKIIEPSVCDVEVSSCVNAEDKALIEACESAVGVLSDVPTSSKRVPKKRSAWYNAFYTNYKKRSVEFHKLFPDIPSSESLIVDYSCAVQREILAHGRMYVSSNFVSFYSNIMGWEAARICLPYKSIISLTKEKTAIVIPNAIEIRCRGGDRHFFATFASRDKTYLMLFRVWQNCLLDQIMSQSEIMNWVKQCYGSDLGPESSDDEEEPGIINDSTDLDDKSSFNDVLDIPREDSEDHTNHAVGEVTLNTALLTASHESIQSLESAGTGGKMKRFKRSVKKNTSMRRNKKTDGTIPRKDSTCLEDTSTCCSTAKDSTNAALNIAELNECSAELSDEHIFENIAVHYRQACDCESHLEHSLLHRSYNLSMNYIYECIFSDNSFSQEFHNSRKIHVEDVTPWKPLPGTNTTFGRTITLSIVSTLKILGSCVIKSVETQFMRRTNGCITIDSEINNSNIPYADKFFVRTRYCMFAVADNKTDLRVTASVEYRKNVWALTKSLIQKNAIHALREAFSELDQRLRDECVSNETSSSESISDPIASQSENASVEIDFKCRSSRNPTDNRPGPYHPATSNYTSISIILMLLISLMINCFLYMKFRRIELTLLDREIQLNQRLENTVRALTENLLKASEHQSKKLTYLIDNVSSTLTELSQKMEKSKATIS